MKKINTAATKQIRNVSEPKLTIGLDLGDRSSWYCLLDDVGEVLLEQKLGKAPKAIREGFGAMPRSRIALETGMHSPWVGEGTETAQTRRELHLRHPEGHVFRVCRGFEPKK